MGTFVFDALGVRWAEELAEDDYNLPGFFGCQRWEYYRKRAEGQNTLVINPANIPVPDQNPEAFAEIEWLRSWEGEARAVADLTPTYAWVGADSIRRGFALFDERTQALVQDEIHMKRPSEVWWFMHTEADNSHLRKLTVHLTDVTDTRITVQLTPLATDDAPVPPPADVVDLNAWRAHDQSLNGTH